MKELFLPSKIFILFILKNPFRDANKLINRIAKTVEDQPEGSLMLRTSISHMQLGIYYDQRMMAQINSTFSEKNYCKYIKITNKDIKPVVKKSFYADIKINLMPYRLELINIYRKLYNPLYNKEWPLLIKTENIFFDNYCKKNTKAGGKSNISLSSLKKLFILNFLNNSEFVLIGDWAANLMLYNSEQGFGSGSKLQIISPHDIYDTFEKIKYALLKLFPKSPFESQYNKQKIYIPDEYRLEKICS